MNNESKLPPASETATPTPRTDRLRNSVLNAFERYCRHEIYLEDFAAFVKLVFSDASHVERELSAATRELEELKVKADMCWGAANYRLKYLGCIYRALGLEEVNMDNRTQEVCDFIESLRSDLLLARQQGEEMRGALEETNTILMQVSSELLTAKSGPIGIFLSESYRIQGKNKSLLATPSPQGNNRENK